MDPAQLSFSSPFALKKLALKMMGAIF